jgi:hypothetical protein
MKLDGNPSPKAKGVPVMSGSAGHDRVIPAHFLVKPIEFKGGDPETAARMTGYLDRAAVKEYRDSGRVPFILLRINHKDGHT